LPITSEQVKSKQALLELNEAKPLNKFEPLRSCNYKFYNNKIMKHLAITIILLSSISSFGQTNYNDIPNDILKELDKMGVDTSSYLNSHEGAYLNVIFKDSLKGFNFKEKKVGFIYSGSKSNKQEYFDQVKNRYHSNHTTISNNMYIFNAAQRVESGGYDAAIVYWSKFSIPIDKVIKKLKTNNPAPRTKDKP
jgi:hypothetical protein